MGNWMLIMILAVVVLLALRLLLMPRLVAAWVQRLRNDPAIDDHNRETAYGLPGFAPVQTELDRVELGVQGQLPGDLQGVYLRNGTNRQFEESRSRLHMFNGAGMLHQVQILSLIHI